jgi:3-hydroxybutyryl-CoA dehydrogenase
MATAVLLLGATTEHPRIVREISQRCRAHDILCALHCIGDLAQSPWAQEWTALQQEYPAADTLTAEEVAFILDLCLSPTVQRREELAALRARYPAAYWLRSGLTETATACAQTLGYPEVVSFNGLPGLFAQLDSLEIAPALTASERTLQAAQEFFSRLGFRTEVVEDRIGLVIPRILAMLINEGAFTVMERVAQPPDIDTAMRLATNYPRGILEWADDIGLDTIVAILDALYAEYHQERYRACVLLRQYVRAARLGRHTGEGFYRYG